MTRYRSTVQITELSSYGSDFITPVTSRVTALYDKAFEGEKLSRSVSSLKHYNRQSLPNREKFPYIMNIDETANDFPLE